MEARECREDSAGARATDAGSPVESEFELSYEILLDTPSVFSVGVNLNEFCGGAHPDHAALAVVFDVAAGLRYDPLKLYALTRGNGTSRELLPPVRGMLRKRLIAARRSQKDDDECLAVLNEDDIQFVDKGAVSLTSTGVRIAYSGPHVVQACYEPVVLPYPQLRRFLNKKEAARLQWKQ